MRFLLYFLNPLAIGSRQINVNFSIQIVEYIVELWTIHLRKRFACGCNDSLEIHNSPFSIRHSRAIPLKIVLLSGIWKLPWRMASYRASDYYWCWIHWSWIETLSWKLTDTCERKNDFQLQLTMDFWLIAK